MTHYNFTAPLVDQFNEIIDKIAFAEVKSWDHKDLFGYAVSQSSANKKSLYDLETLVEDYEDIFSQSITHEINNWNLAPVPWNDYESVMFRGMISAQKGQSSSLYALEPELTESREDILFWSIFLQARDKEDLCILNVANQDEAQLISHSIFDHYYYSE